MKLKNYIIPFLAACVLASCSKGDDMGPKEPDMTPDALLSLVVNADVKVRATSDEIQFEEDANAPRNFISKLSVFVYVGGHCYSKDSIAVNTDTSVNSVTGIPVKAGNATICIVANANAEQIKHLKGLTEISETELAGIPTSTLDKEIHRELTMSSEIFKVTLNVSKTNYIGYTKDDIKDKDPLNSAIVIATPIPLYRNVARVQLSELFVKKETDFGTATSFTLKKVFMANVKSKSNLLPTDGTPWGPTEVKTSDLQDADYWYGLFAKANATTDGDSLKKINTAGTLYEDLCYDLEKVEGNVLTDFSYYDEDRKSAEDQRMDVSIPLSVKENVINNVAKYMSTYSKYIGNFFYVYENTDSRPGYQTLLIVCGDYTYIPKGGTEEVTEPNRYYALVVNGPDNDIPGNFEGVDKHTYIKRNTKYNISLTISGPGSKKPFDPSVRAYVGSKIDVLAWDVVKMEGSVD